MTVSKITGDAPGELSATKSLAEPATQGALSDYSRYAKRVRRRYAQWLALWPTNLAFDQGLKTCFKNLPPHLTLADRLRITRALALERIISRDCDQGASLSEVTLSMTTLAEWALDVSLKHAELELQAIHGVPVGSGGQASELWIVGMGKLGARELNVSSDIDLIFVYSHEGATTGIDAQQRGRISNHEYFQRLVRNVCQRLADVTEHGFVFRVDLALRPHGNSGPTAVSLAGLEDYLLVSGREWERFAWLKSRVVAATGDVASAVGLREVVRHFVYRRYLDYSVFEALRQLHGQIRDHTNRRAAGRPQRHHDVKLSRGGIRELEFIVQLLQVVRGGQYPELCTRPTLKALQKVSAAGLMPPKTAQDLTQAYEFLRRVEHRIQYLDDQQTHLLPAQEEDLAWLASSMGFADTPAFMTELDRHRERVAGEFDRLLGQDAKQEGRSATNPTASGGLSALLTDDVPQAIREKIAFWQDSPRVLSLKEESRSRLARLTQRSLQWLKEGQVSETAALRFADWVEPLLRREAYLALLLERPSVHERLLRVLGAARWPQRYLMQHPGVIDELASESTLTERFDAAQFASELNQRRAALNVSGQGDEESLMSLLRRAQQAELFRTLVRDLEGRISVEQVADDLSALADTILQVSAQWAWEFLKDRHVDQPRIALIGYGKLGGKELGYGSDLDIVCLYDDESPDAAVIYARLVRKLISWLSTKTALGEVYDIDTALRPNGSAGLLVTSMDAFEDYQVQRGSNAAWTWEHQAMTRARCVFASEQMHRRFEQVREKVLTAPRQPQALQEEILAMRGRVRQAHRIPSGLFDVKHSPGGMVDVEFAVQFLVLLHATQHLGLRPNSGNIALLQEAERAGLLPPGVGRRAADAYRELRRAQHLARLDERNPQCEQSELQNEQSAVKALWQAVFPDADRR
jgi:[glutamine synthetase] adenylyltransferase / [glutamine synthetase]-adenylyl-L-tyrosine phosphorylase